MRNVQVPCYPTDAYMLAVKFLLLMPTKDWAVRQRNPGAQQAAAVTAAAASGHSHSQSVAGIFIKEYPTEVVLCTVHTKY